MYNNPFSTKSLKTLKVVVAVLSAALAVVSVVAVVTIFQLRNSVRVTSETVELPTVAKVNVGGTTVSPKTTTVIVGSAIEFVNTDKAPHQIQSDPFPAADKYPALNAAAPTAPGSSHVVVMDKVGTYTYHDKLNPSITGTITVRE